MTSCDFNGCDADGPLKRQSNRDGMIHRYCAEHDPLEDENAAFRFQEVDE